MHKNPLMMLAVAAITAPAVFAAAEWSTDFDAAKAQAAKEGKAVLMDFTGSDWCGWCIKLRKSVFDTDKFQEYAKDKFVLVEVDRPQNKKLAPELELQNSKLCRQFKVDGFPTILVISPEEEVLGGFVGGNFTSEQVEGLLTPAFENLGKLKTARTMEGVERAKAIGAIYKSLPKEFAGLTQNYAKEIAECDPNNESKAMALTPEEHMENFISELHLCGDDYQHVLELIDEYMPKVGEDFEPDLLKIKAQALTLGAKTEEDIVKAREALQEAATMLGRSREARQLRKFIDDEYGDPAAKLKQLQAERKMPANQGACGSELQQVIGKIAKATDQEALDIINAQLAKGKEDERPELLRLQATVLLRMADSLDDVAKAKAVFEESVSLFGDTLDGKNLSDYVKGEFADPEGLLKRVRQERIERTPEKQQAAEELHEVIQAVHRAGNDYKKALRIIENELAKGNKLNRAELLRLKGIALRYSAETAEDLDKAREAMKEAAELMGDTEEADQIRKYLETELQNDDAILESVKSGN